ncbi:hypothetical protein CFOL_v3_07194 [Cephalotus follicularis]|uniref:Uncharacterized protein n=1 Tax=Cephalotus follicularis TaxID=3775 RepID=A0A1Q3B6L9_CEPFO|nr:hypothetical protein CFOL_v3_07194 [Cephalotus follicularis]
MAPRKRKSEREEEKQVKSEATAVRVTRSSTRRANASSARTVTEFPQPELPKKKAKTKAKPKAPEKVKVETVTENGEAKENADVVDESKKKTIVIEHCKQCHSFKTRAVQVKNGLEKSVPGITVLLNPDKPRKGCFEIREEGGEEFISLLEMKRPFKPMKDLDMDKVISDVIDKIKD